MSPATSDSTDLAATLAPEDIRPGAYVAIARICLEFPSYLWCDGPPSLAADEPVRIQWLPPGGGTPLRVEAVCLPFVLVKSPDGEAQTLDLRSVRLLQLTAGYAKRAWKRLKGKANATP
jgi:hypothetical protein